MGKNTNIKKRKKERSSEKKTTDEQDEPAAHSGCNEKSLDLHKRKNFPPKQIGTNHSFTTLVPRA